MATIYIDYFEDVALKEKTHIKKGAQKEVVKTTKRDGAELV